MQSLEKLAKSYLAFEKIDISDFQRKARILQSMWRKERGFKAGEYQGKPRGNYLPMPWAKDTLSNYLSDTIKEVVTKEVLHQSDSGKFYGKPRIFNNLLSSQPLCFNLFAELQQDLELATKVFRQLCPYRVNNVTRIEFEHSPGRNDMTYTGDRSAFDVYVEFFNKSDEKGFIGIEVKYHENLRNTPAEIKGRYFEVASRMGCFKKECLDILQKSPLEQLWRDHLLAGSLLYSLKDGFKDGFFVFLSPQDNCHCQNAVEQYKQCLTVDRTFQSWTLESVAGAIKQNTKKQWIDELIDRYLNFEKVESVVE
ncbi:MAG: hypothetical protein H8D56_01220 [Planctomycetes bacterium]|nr:hypothetical protein [Planctomycetota bacterium]